MGRLDEGWYCDRDSMRMQESVVNSKSNRGLA